MNNMSAFVKLASMTIPYRILPDMNPTGFTVSSATLSVADSWPIQWKICVFCRFRVGLAGVTGVWLGYKQADFFAREASWCVAFPVFVKWITFVLQCYGYNWSHKCLLGFGPMHWPKIFGCLVGNRARLSHCAKLWKLRKMAVSGGKRPCRPLPTFPIEMCKTIFDSLSENHMWLLRSKYLCMEVNAVMRCPNVVKPCWPNKHLVGISVAGAEFSAVGAEFSAVAGGRVLRGAEFSAGPTSPWGRVLVWAEFSVGPSSPVFHNKYPHPPVITPENLTNERTEGRTEPFIKLLGHS